MFRSSQLQAIQNLSRPKVFDRVNNPVTPMRATSLHAAQRKRARDEETGGADKEHAIPTGSLAGCGSLRVSQLHRARVDVGELVAQLFR